MPFDTFSAQMQDKIRSLKPPKDDINQKQKAAISDEMTALIDKVIKKKEAEIATLKKAKSAVLEGKNSEAEKLTKSFLTMNEQNFLMAKPLFYIRDEDGVDQKNAFVLYGRSDNFPCTLSKKEDGHYVFHLPPMSSRRTYESYQASSRHIKYSMMLLIDSYEKEESISILKEPVLVFKHFIADKNQVPDPDNLDMKVAIDTLQNIMITNDCLLDLMLLSYGVESLEAFTELHVMEKEIFKNWL